VDSLTKRPVDADELATLVRGAFGPGAVVVSAGELTDGMYSSAYAVRLADGRELVLKVAPRPDLRLLTHEVDLMRTEVDVYHRCAAVGVPAPAVVFAGFDRSLIGTDYVFLSRLPGRPLHLARDRMTLADHAAARGRAAALAARLHTVTGPAYGYPLRPSRTWCPTWREAFGAMVDDVLGDADRLGCELPMPTERSGDRMRRHADTLDEVTRPALVHFDLWDGNIFVDQHASCGWRVTGLIDGERAFYGDPLAELVSLTLFREMDDAPEVLDGYAEGAGAPLDLTGAARYRLALYAVYLYLIMAIEGRTRGWNDPRRDAWLQELLAQRLARLESVGATG
jgi:aminoglycoside phosphotransferase (APT) family kinase protein